MRIRIIYHLTDILSIGVIMDMNLKDMLKQDAILAFLVILLPLGVTMLKTGEQISAYFLIGISVILVLVRSYIKSLHNKKE